MSDAMSAHPAICLNMIVRNEAHIVTEALDSVAPYIASWVIVDTGSDDGTQDLIKNHMARLGIPGELYERPWRNFGHNRTEALALAEGHGDYIWVMDADDILVGTPDLTQLEADVCSMCIEQDSVRYWRPQLFRNGARVRYQGVIHEHIVAEPTCVQARVEGDYHIESRRLGARNLSGSKLENDRDVLLAEVQRHPEDTRSVFHLAQTYMDLGDFANGQRWYARRAEMGGWDEEIYYSMLRVGEAMSKLDRPWHEVQDAYLRAWEFRPTRAEALYALAARLSTEGRHRRGYLFAKHAAGIPVPEDDILFVFADLYTWRATDLQAFCAFHTGQQAEAFTLWRRLLARPDLPDDDRQRIAGNRDFPVPAMIEAASSYPDELVQRLTVGSGEADITVSLIAGPDPSATEATLNSFVHCCTDVSRVGRFLIVDAGLSAQDRATLHERYRFLEFVQPQPEGAPGSRLAQLCSQIHQRFWLHLGQGWRFFAPDNLITRLAAVLDAEPRVFQVGLNLADAVALTGASAAEGAVRRTPDAGRYLLTQAVAGGPAMFDTTRLAQAGGINAVDPDPLVALGKRATAAGFHSASLDEVLCITTT